VVDTSLPAERVVRTLQQLAAWRGLPKAIRLDNGPELTAQRFTTWCAVVGIELRHIEPAKPNQNAFIVRFNRMRPRQSSGDARKSSWSIFSSSRHLFYYAAPCPTTARRSSRPTAGRAHIVCQKGRYDR